MKTKIASLLLLLALLFGLPTTAHAQDPTPPPPPVDCGWNPFCWAGQILFGSSTTATPVPLVEQIFPPTATPVPFRAPTMVPSHVAAFADNLLSYMNSTGRTTVYAYYLDAYGNINFRTDDTQTPVSEQVAPDGSGKSLTEYLCYDPATKTLPEWECYPDPIYGTWVYGQAGWYTGFLTTISINLSDIYPAGHTTGNTMFYASKSDTGQDCRSVANSYGTTVYICTGYTSYQSVPTHVVVPTATTAATPTPTIRSLCDSEIYCSWDSGNNTVGMTTGNGWTQTVTDFIWGGPGTYSFAFTRVTVTTAWPPSGTVSYCKNVYMPNLPEFTNHMGVSTREYAVCLYP